MATRQFFSVDEELKESFMEFNTNENSYEVVKSRLIKIDRYEQLIGKQIIDWSAANIEDFLRSINSASVVSLRGYLSTASEYVSFIEKNKPDKEILSNFSTGYVLFNNSEVFLRCVNSRKFEENILLYSDYITIIEDETASSLGRTMFVLFWNGINISKINNIFLTKKESINEEECYIVDENGEKKFITPEEMRVITKFLNDQTKNVKVTENGFYHEFVCDEELYHIIDTKTDYLFPDVVGSQDNRPKSKLGYRIYDEPSIRTMRNNMYNAAYQSVVKQYNMIDLKPKGIVKSGAYHRAIMDFGFKKTEDVDSLKHIQKNTNMNVIRDYLKPYCIYQRNEIQYILDSGIYNDETDEETENETNEG